VVTSRSRIALCYLAFAALALLVYGPALGGEFLWDDTDWIRDNETLRSASGLWRIWSEPGAVIQYYPLTYTTWWLDYQLWGLSEVVMHVENVLLHAGNALMFTLLLRRLKLPGAWFAGLVFLLHPVHSESVAWLVERKNTLSAAFYLGACHQWLTHLVQPARGTSLRTALLFLAALLAKTATLMLPVTLFAIAIWHRREWRSSIRALLPFVLMAFAAATVTIIMERGEGAVGHDWALTFAERVALLGQVVGFYLSKLLLPLELSFSYAKWGVADSAMHWLPTIVLLVGLAASLLAVLRTTKPAVIACSLALWIYVANVLPVSGLVDYYYLRYAFVADHFQYLSSLGPIALLCCGGAFLMRKVPACAGVAASLTIMLAIVTWNRASIYQDLEGLWRATIATEPDAWLAQGNLGNLLDRKNGLGAGIEHHRRAIAIYPDAFEANNAVGNDHARRGEFAAAKLLFDRAMQVRPDDPLTFNNLGAMHGMQRNYKDALRWFEEGHQRAPNNRDLLRNMAVVLSQSPDAAVRDGQRALAFANQLNDVSEPSLADEHVLFSARILASDRRSAISLGERVMYRARREGNQSLVERVAAQLQNLRR
jgi:tetratricopeptide (TPR) repeat protein